MDIFISLDKVSYAYPGQQGSKIPAIQDVSLHIQEGEYVALVGANGSGKSTLARLLNALLIPDSGTVSVTSLDSHDVKNHTSIHRTIGMVFQRPEDQMIASSIEDDVAFGPENLAVPSEEIRTRVRQALDTVGLWSLRHRRPDKVSAGQMQRVALAGVLAMHPRCIIFDEATAMLDPAGRKTVRALMRQLHTEGLTIINITHFMEETLDATRLIVLDKGRLELDGKPEDVFRDSEVLQSMGLDLPPVAKLAQTLYQAGIPINRDVLNLQDLIATLDTVLQSKQTNIPLIPKDEIGTPVLQVRDLDYVYFPGTPGEHKALVDVNLKINKHQSHGLMGATGAGKSTLLQHLNGLLRPQRGEVIVDGHNLSDPETDLLAVRRRVGLVFQIPESQIFEQYVGDEIAYGPRLTGLEGDALRRRVKWAMDLVGLDFESTKDRPTFALSGGEKRKVALASSLALRPDILLLDEPTAGLDPASRHELLRRLGELSSEMTLVVSSHRMEDLAVLVEELSVLSYGKMVMDGDIASVFAQHQNLEELGLDVPVVTQVVLGLRDRGWLLSEGIVKETQLVQALVGGYG